MIYFITIVHCYIYNLGSMKIVNNFKSFISLYLKYSSTSTFHN